LPDEHDRIKTKAALLFLSRYVDHGDPRWSFSLKRRQSY
jgi:hypothetical protein